MLLIGQNHEGFSYFHYLRKFPKQRAHYYKSSANNRKLLFVNKLFTKAPYYLGLIIGIGSRLFEISVLLRI